MSLKSGPTKQFTNLPEFDACQITTSKMLLSKTGRSEAFEDQSANVDIGLKRARELLLISREIVRATSHRYKCAALPQPVHFCRHFAD